MLPAYNEADNLEKTLRDLILALEANAKKFEVIVVDDGSGDRTGEIARAAARADGRVKLIAHEVNRGYGAALRSGFEAATLDWIFFMDSDGQFVPDEMEKLIALAGEERLVAGYRKDRRDPFERRLYGRLFTLVTRTLFGLRVRDMNCAFKLFKRDIVAGAGLSAGGALINAEILLAAKKAGVVPAEVAVTHLPRRGGLNTGGSVRVIIKAASELAALVAAEYLGRRK